MSFLGGDAAGFATIKQNLVFFFFQVEAAEKGMKGKKVKCRWQK